MWQSTSRACSSSSVITASNLKRKPWIQKNNGLAGWLQEGKAAARARGGDTESGRAGVQMAAWRSCCCLLPGRWCTFSLRVKAPDCSADWSPTSLGIAQGPVGCELNWCSWGTAKPAEAPEPGGEPYPWQLTAAGLGIPLSQSLRWLSSSSAVSVLTFAVPQQRNRLVEMFLGNADSGSNLIAAFVSQNQTAKARSSA